MNIATTNRLVGLCVLAMVTIAAFSTQMVVWSYTRMPHLKGAAVASPLIYAILALIAAVCAWKQKPIGYVLVLLVCSLQNISTVRLHYSQSGTFGFSDILDLSLTGLPLLVAMLAALSLLLHRHRSPQNG